MSEKVERAWARIGASQDGRMARELLVDVLLRVPSVASNPGALQVDLGRRNFAQQILNLLDADQKPDALRNDTSAKRSDPGGSGGGNPRRSGAACRVPAKPS